jgi:hypothetical protein
MSERLDEKRDPREPPQPSGAAVGGAALDALMRAAKEAGGAGERPVEKWNPPYCGDIGLRIRSDGTWLYQNSPIGRIALVKLFASILRKDADANTYLVTPAEKILVTVDDAPFLAVDMVASGEGEASTLTMRTNVDDVVTVDAAHPLRFVRQEQSGGLKPYVRVRGRLEALVTRAVYADLVALAVPREASCATLGVWSGGIWWEMA